MAQRSRDSGDGRCSPYLQLVLLTANTVISRSTWCRGWPQPFASCYKTRESNFGFSRHGKATLPTSLACYQCYYFCSFFEQRSAKARDGTQVGPDIVHDIIFMVVSTRRKSIIRLQRQTFTYYAVSTYVFTGY